jgi:dipeptidyl aminopeptidase/acylaminoacyl peptidase
MDRGGSERTQLFLLEEDGARTVPLTEGFPDAIHYPGAGGGWSPDGHQIAFAANRRSVADFDIYVQPVAPVGPATLVYEGRGTSFVQGWGPSGDYLIFVAYHTPANQDIFQLNLADGSTVCLTPHQGDVRFQQVALAPNGHTLYCSTDHESDVLRPVAIDMATLSLRVLLPSAWDVDLLALAPNGATLAVVFNEDGVAAWRLIDTTSGRDLPVPLLPQGLVFSSVRWSPDGRALLFDYTGPQHNADVWQFRFDPEMLALLDHAGEMFSPALPEAPRLTRITHSSRAGLPRAGFVQPELVHYRSFDGRPIPAWLYLPTGSPRRNAGLPMIVDVHGGPESQRRVEFNPIYQYFVDQGFGILAPNVRGSTGYGKAYERLDNVEQRPDSVADLAYAAGWLRSEGIAHPERIAVMGGSYGGYMVLAALTEYPDLWAAGVDIVGIANLVTFLEHTGPWRRHLREAEYGSLERDRALLESLSPIHKVDRIRAPLLVIHGANDPRVPVGEAEQIVASLRQRSRTVQYLRFEDEGHGIVKLANRLVCYPAIAAFLAEHVGS